MEVVVEAAGLLGATATILIFVPQAWAAWRNRTNGAAFEGLATGTVWLSLIGSCGWLVYGLGIDAIWTAIPSFVNIPLSIFILVLVRHARRGP